jgi:gliding motility-associated-like protein
MSKFSQKLNSSNMIWVLFISLYLNSLTAFAQGNPVVAGHPRIFLDPTTKAMLLAKKANNDAQFTALMADADKWASYPVHPWTPDDANVWHNEELIYNYCGSNYEEYAMTLGMAHQLTKGTNTGALNDKYSDKMNQLADEIIKAYTTWKPAAKGSNLFQFNSYYATRHMGKTVAILYDWAYDELGSARKTKMIDMMEDWFSWMRNPANDVYQSSDNPTGNYYLGHPTCAAYMGYAIAGDSRVLRGSTISQQMLDWARQRILGTQSGTLPTKEKSNAWFTQSIVGGLPSGASTSYNGNMNPPDLATYVAAPQKDGLPVQGWAYGGSSTNYLADWCFLVKSCTGEDVANDAAMRQYFDKTAKAMVYGYLPNRFSYGPSNDNGTSMGSVADYSMALRLAAICEGSSEGPRAQQFYKTWLKPVILANYNKGTLPLSWEKMLFDNPRPISAELATYNPFYPLPEKNVFKSVAINSGLQTYYMRKDWSATATWSSVDMGAAVFDAHNHNNAGHFKIIRGDANDGDDFLLIGGNEVGNAEKFGANGIEGPTNYSYSSSFSNTLYFDDNDVYKRPNQTETEAMGVGGQTSAGFDEPTHAEQNTSFSYFRSDLTSAYYVDYYEPQISERTLDYYYRSFIYLRNSDIFLVYDNFKESGSGTQGKYKKHLRWHFMENPTISADGKNVTAIKDKSKLYVHTVLPDAVTTTKVNESNNPDDFSSDHSLGSIFNSYTWRAEVNVANNPSKQDILTVMQPGSLSAKEMKTTAIKSIQGNMEGSLVELNGNTELVLFNSVISKYLTPITLVSYSFKGPLTTMHTLCGLDPDKNYQVDYAASTVTVTLAANGNFQASPAGVLSFRLAPLAQTITFETIQPVTYGATDFVPDASSTNASIPIIYKSSNPLVATEHAGIIHIVGVGSTLITASQAGDKNYIPATDVTQTLIVSKAPLTITADAKAKIQGTVNPSLTATYTGFAYAENSTVLLTQASLSTTAVTTSPVGDYPIKAAGATAANYDINYVDGTLKITATAPLITQTLSLNAKATATYGAADFSIGASSFNKTIDITYTSSNTAIATIVGDKIHILSAGTVTITAKQAGNAMYSPATDAIQILTIEKAPLTITADAKTKIQGSVNPTLTTTYSGFVYGETNTILTVQPSITTTATTSSPIGDYAIKAIGATSSNYDINYVDGTLKITATAQLITPALTIAPTSTITYGGSDFSAGATSDNNTIEITYSSNNPNVATIVNGKVHIVGVGTTDITASQAGNASYSAATPVKQNLTIDKAKLVITADAKTKVQGAANPTLTATYFGFVYTDNLNALTTSVNLSTVATTSSPVGDYPIVASNATANNYSIQFINGSLKVTSATLTAQVLSGMPTSASITYGAADFSAGASSTNSTIGITYASSNTSVATIVNAKVHIVGAGTTTITASQPGNSSYTAAADVTQTLTIKQAPLTITADIQVKTLGSPNPPLTIAYSGFVYGENSSALNPLPTISTTASTFSPVGSYPITVTAAAAKNYTITYGNSTMTVSNANQLPQVPIIQSDIQNILSPNGDGVNDFWIIKNIELYPDNNVKILDRLGRILYQKKGYDNTWDGKYNGKLLATDAYYFLIELGKNLSKFKGMVTIVEK